jgi:arginase family enzyme
MLSDKIRLLNFDDSVAKQAQLISHFSPEIVDLKETAPAFRLWSDKKTSDKIKKSLKPESRHSITFLGSGDFHHASSLLIEQFNQPLSVIIFDHHPDWDMFFPGLSCGSWVNSVLKKPNIKKIILLGTSSEDISSFWLQSGNLKSLENNRVEIYPFAHKPSLALFKNVADNISMKVERKLFFDKIHWQELKNRNLSDFFFDLKNRLEAKQVYVSIDKDCLKSDYALTNWEEGCFELSELLNFLGLIKDNLDIVGLDISGDYSPVKAKGWLKRMVSHLDHPKNYSARKKSEEACRRVDELTNLKLLKIFLR